MTQTFLCKIYPQHFLQSLKLSFAFRPTTGGSACSQLRAAACDKLCPWFDKAHLLNEWCQVVTMTYSMGGLSFVCLIGGKQNKQTLIHIKQFYNVLFGTPGTSNCCVCCDVEACANQLRAKGQISKWTCVQWHVWGRLYRCKRHALNFKEGCVEPDSSRGRLTVKCLGLRVDTMSTFIRQGPKWNGELMD